MLFRSRCVQKKVFASLNQPVNEDAPTRTATVQADSMTNDDDGGGSGDKAAVISDAAAAAATTTCN